MEVILQQEMENLGTIGDIVKVKRGYARNFLLPRGIAVEANSRKAAEFEHRKRALAAKRELLANESRAQAAKLSKVTVVITAKAGEHGRLFGSVTSQDVQAALEAQGVEVDRRKLSIEGPFKQVGDHEATIALGAGVKATIHVRVVAEATPEEAKAKPAAAEERTPEVAEKRAQGISFDRLVSTEAPELE